MTDDEMMFRALCESDGDHKSWVNMERIVAENKKLREALKDLLADFDEYGNVGKHWDSVVRVREALGKGESDDG